MGVLGPMVTRVWHRLAREVLGEPAVSQAGDEPLLAKKTGNNQALTVDGRLRRLMNVWRD